MARPKRIDLPHSLYHLMSRTISGGVCFPDKTDMSAFLELLEKYCSILDFRIHAFCLMPNHFHLLLESGAIPGLSRFMHRLLTSYTFYFNSRHDLQGHLFQGRYKSFLVEKSEYLLALSRYIHLNPASENGVEFAEKYFGSSLRYYLGGNVPPFLKTGEILSWFDNDRQRYRKFIHEGLNEDTKPGIVQQRFVGGKEFVHRMNKRLKLMNQHGSRSDQARVRTGNIIEESQKRIAEKILEETCRYFDLNKAIMTRRWSRGKSGKARSVLIILLRRNLLWSCARIAKFAGLTSADSIPYHLRKKDQEDIALAISEIANILKQAINYSY